MTDAVQQVLTKLIDNAPAIIAAVASGCVVVWRSNKKTDESAQQTNQLVVKNTEKLGDVHEQVNGNLSALQAKHDALAQENTMLKDQLSHAGKRSTDKRSPDRKPGKP